MANDNAESEHLTSALERLTVHDHLCLIYATPEEQFAAIVPFVRFGLERGERCIYIADENTGESVLARLRAGGIDADAATHAGALVIASKQDAYLKQGYFDPDWMINFLAESTRDAKAAGYAALRATGEMTWALGGDPGAERLIEYEAKLNRFFPAHDALAICQYNRARFRPEIICDVIRTHPVVIWAGLVCRNFYFVPPDEFLEPNQPSLEAERLLGNILERERVEDELKATERKYRAIFENAVLGIVQTTFDGRIIVANRALASMLGYGSPAELASSVDDVGRQLYSHQEDFGNLIAQLGKAGIVANFETQMRCKNGALKWISINARIVDGAPPYVEAMLEDITERRRSAEALREQEALIHRIIDSVDEGFIVVDREYRILSANRAFCSLVRRTEDRVVGYPCHEVSHHSARPCIESGEDCPVRRTFDTGAPYSVSHVYTDAPGNRLNVELRSYPVTDASGTVVSVIETVNNVTEARQLEQQLRQAQKMEAVGRLAGGVAHDFNNMLGVILGHAELALDQLDSEHFLFGNLQEIRTAAERSVELTRQLLAFARKQTAAPEVLDLDQTVLGMLKMLRRLIGEDIDLAWAPGAGMWPVKVDPSQVDQILANLCVNARDAIAGVGTITIETHQATLDEDYCGYHPGFRPGEYVLLEVTDNGSGMDREALDRLFEPFFTTKELGKGTGLGLATVYGIVRQNNGFINVYSEPGHGTTFKIYLPRHTAETGKMRQEGPAPSVERGDETILLVEDDRAMLDMTRLMLESVGYRVLAASTPREAVRLAKGHAAEIDLLMTDVVMPEMNGRDLANLLTSLYPGMRRLFTSGYTANVIAHHGVLDEDVHFIQKPFSTQSLAAKVREALDGK